MTSLSSIYCIGGATVDIKLKAHTSLQRATSNPATTTMTLGGVAHNVARNLANWTTKIHLQTLVANDSAGQEILKQLAQLGIDTLATTIIVDANTAHYYALIDKNGDLEIALADMAIFDRVDSTFSQSWLQWTPGSIIFIDTNLPADIINKAMHYAADKQLRLCVDPVSTFKAKKLTATWPNIFLIKPNLLEASALTNMPLTNISDCLKASRALHKRGAEHVVISLGQDGYILCHSTACKHIKANIVTAVTDANGAGDTFMAGIIYGIQHNMTIEAACEFGADAAILTIQEYANTPC